MTDRTGPDRAARRTRWSKRRIRVVAWSTGVATFVVSGGALAVAPKPATAAAGRPHHAKQKQARPVIERTIIRRVVIVDPPSAASAPAGGAPIVVTQSAPVANPAPAPAPAPAPTTTGGS
ncbi:MAG: hypothetical protein ACM3OO_02045 [Planctomycetaceae bacterium]